MRAVNIKKLRRHLPTHPVRPWGKSKGKPMNAAKRIDGGVLAMTPFREAVAEEIAKSPGIEFVKLVESLDSRKGYFKGPPGPKQIMRVAKTLATKTEEFPAVESWYERYAETVRRRVGERTNERRLYDEKMIVREISLDLGLPRAFVKPIVEKEMLRIRSRRNKEREDERLKAAERSKGANAAGSTPEEPCLSDKVLMGKLSEIGFPTKVRRSVFEEVGFTRKDVRNWGSERGMKLTEAPIKSAVSKAKESGNVYYFRLGSTVFKTQGRLGDNLRRELDKLSEPQVRLLELIYLKGMSLSAGELSYEINITANPVRARILELERIGFVKTVEKGASGLKRIMMTPRGQATLCGFLDAIGAEHVNRVRELPGGNERDILRTLLMYSGPVTSAEIIQSSGYSKSAVHRYVNSLLRGGLVGEVPRYDAAGFKYALTRMGEEVVEKRLPALFEEILGEGRIEEPEFVEERAVKTHDGRYVHLKGGKLEVYNIFMENKGEMTVSQMSEIAKGTYRTLFSRYLGKLERSGVIGNLERYKALNGHKIEVLNAIRKLGGVVTKRDIMELTGCTKSSVQHALRDLVKLGFITGEVARRGEEKKYTLVEEE